MKISYLPVGDLTSYDHIPIAFEGHSRLDINALRDGRYVEIPVLPFVKDYDDIESPAEWSRRFDVSNWIRLGREGGSAIVAWSTAGVDMLEGRDDLAVLWDIRVHPEHRGKGIGQAIVEAAEVWAKEKGCNELKVETQDNNVAACLFYKKMGFQLTEIVPNAYPGLQEAMLLWRKRLAP